MNRKKHYTCVSYSRDKAKPGCRETIRAKRGDSAALREAGWAPAGPVRDMWKCPACKISVHDKPPAPTPGPGRILHYHVPFVGWRPMIVTSVSGPTSWYNDKGVNPSTINGWAILDPEDCGKQNLMDKLTQETGDNHLVNHHEYPVIRSVEGEDFGNWRWPPRSN